MRALIFFYILYMFNAAYGQKLKPIAKFNIEVKEPSDIKYDKQRNSFWIVSDNGRLVECDLNGKKIRKAKFKGVDFEGVDIVGNYVVVVDETDRKVHFFDKKSLDLIKTIPLYYAGARNKGFESILYNDKTNEYYLFTEMDPTYLFVYDKNFSLINQIELTFSTDISSARWHNGDLWILSDEDHAIYVLDHDMKVKKKMVIPVINPEGITFADGKIYIVSDDLEKIYVFNENN